MKDGAFIWYDLATTDPAAAAAFYENVVGWTAEAVPEMHYTLFKMGESMTAGLMELPPHLREANVPPHWGGYILVDDVDAMARRVTEAGGSVKREPDDIPGVGRFAVVGDPDGAPFYLFKPSGQGGEEPSPMSPGRVGWHELRARDAKRALGFYGSLFGWTESRAMDMGPMGTYHIFAYDGLDRGGVMAGPDGVPPSWLFYFAVAELDAAMGRVQQGGGAVIHGPQEVPGGAWIIVCRDPQGAAFALVSGKR